MQLTLTATLDLGGRHPVLKLSDGQTVQLAREDVTGLTDGEPMSIRVLPQDQSVLEQQELARALLGELMKNDE